MTQRVLGIDPGTQHLGYGLLEVKNWEGHYVTAGVLNASKSLSIGERLHRIHSELLQVVGSWRPDVIAVEEPFIPVEGAARGGYKTSVRSAIAVGQAQAVALLAAAQYNLPVFRYPPSQVKSAVSGYGQGSKDQVATMVGLLLKLPSPPEPSDAADALAVALCYIQQERLNSLTRTSPGPV